MYIKFNILFIHALLFFMIAPLHSMIKNGPDQLHMYKTPTFDDNSGACLLCGLAGCACACASISIFALIESLPGTALVWGLCSLVPVTCLQEVYLGYKDEQKRQALDKNA